MLSFSGSLKVFVAVEEGLAGLDRGERIPLEEARKRIPQWISKYSSPTSR